MTRRAGLAVLLNVGMAVSWLPRATGNIIQTNLALIVVAVTAAALAPPGTSSILDRLAPSNGVKSSFRDGHDLQSHERLQPILYF
jgi:hypothetical protein